MDQQHRPTGKRERINPTGTPGGSHFVRRDAQGHFTSNQVDAGRSVAADRRRHAKHGAPKGMKDGGD